MIGPTESEADPGFLDRALGLQIYKGELDLVILPENLCPEYSAILHEQDIILLPRGFGRTP